jgi:hypothetical protein
VSLQSDFPVVSKEFYDAQEARIFQMLHTDRKKISEEVAREAMERGAAAVEADWTTHLSAPVSQPPGTEGTGGTGGTGGTAGGSQAGAVGGGDGRAAGPGRPALEYQLDITSNNSTMYVDDDVGTVNDQDRWCGAAPFLGSLQSSHLAFAGLSTRDPYQCDPHIQQETEALGDDDDFWGSSVDLGLVLPKEPSDSIVVSAAMVAPMAASQIHRTQAVSATAIKPPDIFIDDDEW